MKYRLLAPHVLSDGQWLVEGTEVGEDTPYPWKGPDGKEDLEPTTQMEGLDEGARAKVKAVWQKLYGRDPAWESQNEDVRKAREKEAEDQKKLDEGSEPVSPQQKAERKYEEENKEGKRGEASMAPTIPPRAPVVAQPGVARQPSHTASPATPTRGGTTHPSPGTATPRAPKDDELRPSKPNEEQYPKD